MELSLDHSAGCKSNECIRSVLSSWRELLWWIKAGSDIRGGNIKTLKCKTASWHVLLESVGAFFQLCLFPVSCVSYPHCSSFSSLLPSSCFPSSLPPLFLSKTVKVKIIDDEEYEKNKTFYIEIGEPHLVESDDAKGQEEGERLDLFECWLP